MEVNIQERKKFRLIFSVEYFETFPDSTNFFQNLGVGFTVPGFLIDIENSLGCRSNTFQMKHIKLEWFSYFRHVFF